MHERTQRAVARLLFVFCCAIPSATVLMIVLVSWTPWYQAKKLEELTYNLSRETGLTIQVESFERTAPGKYLLTNVRLSDPDSRRHVANVRMIDFFHGDDKIAVILHQAEFQSSGLGDSWRMLHDRMISRPARTVLPITIIAKDVNIISNTGSLPFPDVKATITPEGDNVRVIAHAEDLANPHGPRLSVNLERNRQGDHPQSRIVVSTQGTGFRCSALAEYSPAIAMLGPDATFTGVIQCYQTQHGWAYDFGGSSLTEIDLDELTAELPHRVVGRGEIHFDRATIQPGESADIVGTLGTPNTASLRLQAPLLAQMQTHLGVNIAPQWLTPNPNGIECKLAAHFEIHDQTLSIAGTRSTAILFSHGQAIAWVGPAAIPADQVTKTLAPPNRWLASWNQILLPSLAPTPHGVEMSAQIRSVQRIDAAPSIRQE